MSQKYTNGLVEQVSDGVSAFRENLVLNTAPTVYPLIPSNNNGFNSVTLDSEIMGDKTQIADVAVTTQEVKFDVNGTVNKIVLDATNTIIYIGGGIAEGTSEQKALYENDEIYFIPLQFTNSSVTDWADVLMQIGTGVPAALSEEEQAGKYVQYIVSFGATPASNPGVTVSIAWDGTNYKNYIFILADGIQLG